MRENQPWVRRASSAAVFIAVVVVVVVCEQVASLSLSLLAPTAPPVVAVLFDATTIGLVAVFVVRRFVRDPLVRCSRDAAALLAAVPDPLAVVDGRGRVLAANAAVPAAFGVGADLVGRPLFAALPPELARTLLQQVFDAQRAGRPQSFDDDGPGRRRRFSLTPQGQDRVIVHVGDITEAARLKAVAALAADIDQRAPAPQDVSAVLRMGCGALMRLFDAEFAWIAGKEEHGTVAVLACAGREADCEAELKRGGYRWDDGPAGRNPVAAAIRTGKPQVHRLNDAGVQEWHKATRRLGAQAVAAVPLVRGDEVLGALVLGGRDADAFDGSEVTALALVAGRIAAVLAATVESQRLELMTTGLETASNAVFVTNRDGVIEWANAAFSRMSGLARHEIIGRTPRVLKSGVQDAAFYQDLWRVILAGGVWNGEVVERRKDGSTYLVRQTVTPIRDFRGDVSHYVAVHEDVTAQRDVEERLRHMAQYDTLTDLPNRALFFDRLGQGMTVARRNNYSLGLLCLDLDHFRLVNDGFGLRIGDHLLQMVAARLRQCVRESDTVARLAADQFTIILPQVLVREDAARVAQKVLEAVKPPFEIDGQDVRIGISIGIALYPQDGDGAEQLIARAEAALGIVKTQNRNGYRFASVS